MILHLVNKTTTLQFQGGDIKQISPNEFTNLFRNDKSGVHIQDKNGKDTGIQYDFIPHVESEYVPESGTYTFFLRESKPQLLLFGDDYDDSLENLIEEHRSENNKNFQRRPRIIDDLDAITIKSEKESKSGSRKSIRQQSIGDNPEEEITNVQHSKLTTTSDVTILLNDSKEEYTLGTTERDETETTGIALIDNENKVDKHTQNPFLIDDGEVVDENLTPAIVTSDDILEQDTTIRGDLLTPSETNVTEEEKEDSNETTTTGSELRSQNKGGNTKLSAAISKV